ncbi:MAG: hypothetical protein AB1638_08300 [Nitrospirota bacterium]
MSDLSLRKELKERFVGDLSPSEKIFFLKKAKEAIILKRYQACEDLFHYCYFLTMKERLRCISIRNGEGYMRFLLIEGKKDIEEAIKLYEEKLEAKKSFSPDERGYKFLEYFAE